MDLTFATADNYTPVIHEEAFECAHDALDAHFSDRDADCMEYLRYELAMTFLARWHSDPEALVAAQSPAFGTATASMQALQLYAVALKDADSIVATIDKWTADPGRFNWRIPKGKKLDAYQTALVADYAAATADR